MAGEEVEIIIGDLSGRRPIDKIRYEIGINGRFSTVYNLPGRRIHLIYNNLHNFVLHLKNTYRPIIILTLT